MENQLEELIDELETEFYDAFRETIKLHCADWPEDNGELNILEGFRQSFRLLSAGHLQYLESDPAYPLLIKNQSLQRQMQLPSVDAVYHWAQLDGQHTYRIHGHRGSARIFQIAVYEGSSSEYPNLKVASTVDNFEDDTFAANTSLDVVLSADPHEGTWIQLPPGGCELFVRQYYYDWENEEPAWMWIEREGAVYPPPALDPKQLRKGASRVASWLRAQSKVVYRTYVQSILDSEPLKLKAIRVPGAFEGTWYLNGHFRCTPDQAVILEVDQPDALFWGFQLGNLQWEALDYYVRATSLNGHQAAIDADGKFRAVISHLDPGVANWLDPGGRILGLISGRYFKSTTVPEPKLKVVPFEDLSSALPSDCKRITPEQRQKQLRQRLLSAHKRYCSDQ